MSEFRSDVSSTYYTTARLVGERCTDDIINKSRASSDTSDSNRFVNTRMCVFYQRGACTKGANCTYAHTKDELKRAPNLLKTRLCQDWLNGSCTTADCKFAHGRQELRFTHDYYKTKLCHFWQQGGCTKGDLCRHAHGESELRPAPEEMICIASSTTRASSNTRMGTVSYDDDGDKSDDADLMMVPHPDSPKETTLPGRELDLDATDSSTPSNTPTARRLNPARHSKANTNDDSGRHETRGNEHAGDRVNGPAGTKPVRAKEAMDKSDTEKSGADAGKELSVCKKASAGKVGGGGRSGKTGKLTSGLQASRGVPSAEGTPPPDENPPERTPTVTFCVSSSSFSAIAASKKSRATKNIYPNGPATGHIRTSGNEAGSQSSTTSSLSQSKQCDAHVTPGSSHDGGIPDTPSRSGVRAKRTSTLKEEKSGMSKDRSALWQNKGQSRGVPMVRAHEDYLHPDGGEIVYLNNRMGGSKSQMKNQVTGLRGSFTGLGSHGRKLVDREEVQQETEDPADRRIAYLEALRLAEVARDLAKKSSELLQQATGGEWDSTALLDANLSSSRSVSPSSSISPSINMTPSHSLSRPYLADEQQYLNGAGFSNAADLVVNRLHAAMHTTNGSAVSGETSGSSASGSPVSGLPASRSIGSLAIGQRPVIRPIGQRPVGSGLVDPSARSPSQAESICGPRGLGDVFVSALNMEDEKIPMECGGGQQRYSAFVPNFKQQQQQLWDQRNSAPECDLDRLAAKLNEFLIGEGETPLYEDTLK